MCVRLCKVLAAGCSANRAERNVIGLQKLEALQKEQKLNVVIDPVSAKDLQASFKPQMKPIEKVDEASPNGQPNQSNVQHEDAHLFVFNNGTESISIILFCNSRESG
ncbi:hypothetical protein Droror1_Dr00002390 [Drosera rotundifolia]